MVRSRLMPFTKFDRLFNFVFTIKSLFLSAVFCFLFFTFSSVIPLVGITEGEKRSFFESKIRPVLSENCYECHNSIIKSEGNLVLDYKEGILRGGAHGSAIVPGDPGKSLLFKAINHELYNLKMPKGGPKLTPEVIRDFKKWIEDGAFDPRGIPPTAKQLAEETSWEKIREKRKKWWSFQPIKSYSPPQQKSNTWSQHPVDQFLFHKMNEIGLQPNEDASAYSVLRRLTFALTGLPPSLEQQEKYLAKLESLPDSTSNEIIDQLLKSPHFGERWARHWMDWVRYADSHGSEGDPKIPNSFRYRNYLIRALNQDVGYDQLVMEHMAGDLLPEPRINSRLGINESIIGTAHLRFVLHGFAPTDALDEHVRFTDDQIDATSKTFLGLTISCARCHHHKFDAISQDDYYALFGILSNGRPAQRVIESTSLPELKSNHMSRLKDEVREMLSESWYLSVETLADTLLQNENKGLTKAIKEKHPHNPFQLWERLAKKKDDDFIREWEDLERQVRQSELRLSNRYSGKYRKSWKLGDLSDFTSWSRGGTGLKLGSSKSGSFSLFPKGNHILRHILPSGAFTHLLSDKENGTLSSPRFKFDKGNIWIRAMGDENSTIRYVVWNYPRKGTVYPKTAPDQDNEKWITWNTDYWDGETGYVEATTDRNHPVEAGNSVRSWFGITEVVLSSPDNDPPKDEIAEILSPFFAIENKPINLKQLAYLYQQETKRAISAWKKGDCSNAQARILNFMVQRNLLPNTIDEVPACSEVLELYRNLENEIISPRLVPGVLDSDPFEQTLFIRGDHKKAGHLVPRRFLEAIDSTPYPKDSIGRLEYARDLLREDNPFTARVIVNRIWHHLFGKGLVATTNNFGRLGDLPSHPELLDYLAAKFKADDWSLKSMIRFLISSKAFRMSSTPSQQAKSEDSSNYFHSHSNLRRLEAESIRDSLLVVSNLLKLTPVGEGKSEGSNSMRRSIYLQTKRNTLHTFLTAFDFPVPSSSTGRRDVTNVPAQALTMMNDPSVLKAARELARRFVNQEEKVAISEMFRLVLSRFPTDAELRRCITYLDHNDGNEAGLQSALMETKEKIHQMNARIMEINQPLGVNWVADNKIISSVSPNLTQPVLHWDFKTGLLDSMSQLRCHLKNGAYLKNDALIVRNGGYAVTERLPFDLSEKTISAWVKLDNLFQRAGGVMTVQSINGRIFDSIVFAEKKPGKWLSGSNRFSRTQSFQSTITEKEADHNFIHFLITYSSNGTITGFRNGELYGRAYKSKTYDFEKGNSIITFGLRHLPSSSQRLLEGSILCASLYKDALRSSEIKSIYNYNTRNLKQVKEANLSAEAKKELEELKSEKAELEEQYLQCKEEQNTREANLEDIALALFNMKEFIYIK